MKTHAQRLIAVSSETQTTKDEETWEGGGTGREADSRQIPK
jgi:hypothetical protein